MAGTTVSTTPTLQQQQAAAAATLNSSSYLTSSTGVVTPILNVPGGPNTTLLNGVPVSTQAAAQGYVGTPFAIPAGAATFVVPGTNIIDYTTTAQNAILLGGTGGHVTPQGTMQYQTSFDTPAIMAAAGFTPNPTAQPGSPNYDLSRAYYLQNPSQNFTQITQAYNQQQGNILGGSGTSAGITGQTNYKPPVQYNTSSAAGIAAMLAGIGGAANLFVGGLAQAEGYAGPLLAMSTTGVNIPFSIANFAAGLISSGMSTVAPQAQTVSPTQAQIAAAPNVNIDTLTAYTPYGTKAQTELQNVKAIYEPGGEVDFYQKIANTDLYNLVSSGSQNALQSGMFTINAPETPVVYTQAGTAKGIFASSANTAAALKVLANPNAYSGLGSEVYGGYVSALNPAYTVQSTGAQLSTYANPNNLANLVNPQAVNLPKGTIPDISAPWYESASAPALQMLSTAGLTPVNVSAITGVSPTVKGISATYVMPTQVAASGVNVVQTGAGSSNIFANRQTAGVPLWAGLLGESFDTIIGGITGIFGTPVTPFASLAQPNAQQVQANALVQQYNQVGIANQAQTQSLQQQQTALTNFAAGKVSNGYWTGSQADYNTYNTMLNQYNSNVSQFNANQGQAQNILGTGLSSGLLLQQPGGGISVNPTLATPYGQFSYWSQGASGALQAGNYNLFGINIPLPKQPTPQQFAAYEQTPAYQNQNILQNIVYGAGKSFVENPGQIVSSTVAGIGTGYIVGGASEGASAILGPISEGTGAGSSIARVALSIGSSPIFQYGVVPVAFGTLGYYQASKGFTASPQETQVNIGSMTPSTLGFILGGLSPSHISTGSLDNTLNWLSTHGPTSGLNEEAVFSFGGTGRKLMVNEKGVVTVGSESEEFLANLGNPLNTYTLEKVSPTSARVGAFDPLSLLETGRTAIIEGVPNAAESLMRATYRAPSKLTDVYSILSETKENPLAPSGTSLETSITKTSQYYELPSVNVPLLGKVSIPFLNYVPVGEALTTSLSADTMANEYAATRILGSTGLSGDLVNQEYIVRSSFPTFEGYIKGEEAVFGTQVLRPVAGSAEYLAAFDQAVAGAKTPESANEAFNKLLETGIQSSYSTKSVAFGRPGEGVTLSNVFNEGQVITEAIPAGKTVQMNQVADISPYILGTEKTFFGTAGGELVGTKTISVSRIPSVNEAGISDYTANLGAYFERTITPESNIVAEGETARASQFINQMLGSSFPTRGEPTIGEGQGIIQNVMDRIAIRGDLTANAGRIPELEFGAGNIADIATKNPYDISTGRFRGGGRNVVTLGNVPQGTVSELPDYMRPTRTGVIAVEQERPLIRSYSESIAGRPAVSQSLNEISPIAAPKPGSNAITPSNAYIEEIEEGDYFAFVPPGRPTPLSGLTQLTEVRTAQRVVPSIGSFLDSVNGQTQTLKPQLAVSQKPVQAQKTGQQQETRSINDIISSQMLRNVQIQVPAQTTRQAQRGAQLNEQGNIFDQLTLPALTQIPATQQTTVTTPTNTTRTPPPPPPLFPLGNQGTGSGPSGGGSIGISKFTERLNIVTSRQALIGDRINTMTGLGRQTIKQTKKNRLF